MEAFATHGEKRAAFEDLHLDALFEHVGGRGHGDVSRAGLGQKAATRFGEAGFDGGLVDRTGEHVCCTH